ncbi:MAG: YjbE family putative metal transport protein, partial [Beijerinckiaceae bacterium]|nr:YjbE family putative metal transport protein [Beijerinckiaceae bacterium]
FTLLVVELLTVPFLKIAGGVLLLWIACKLAAPEEHHREIAPAKTLWSAVRTIAIADAVMSLDNMVAVAAAAKGSKLLILFGLALSIPLLIFGSTFLLALINRFPVLVWAGAGLLGWIAGELIGSDPNLAKWLHPHWPGYEAWSGAAGAALVLAYTGLHHGLRPSLRDPGTRAVLIRAGTIGVFAAAAIGGIIATAVLYERSQDKLAGTAVPNGEGLVPGGGPGREQIEEPNKPSAEKIEALRAQAAKLPDLLLQRSPVTAPLARQAVDTAVQALAQGAADGENRLELALGLLQQAKIAEALPLLEAAAKDEAERSGKSPEQGGDRMRAAVSYRTLGAIASLRDPERALAAYEKALALDPEDAGSLLNAGWISITLGEFDEAQSRLEHLLKLAERGDPLRYKHWALTGLGDIRMKRGNFAAAQNSYSGGLAIISRLAKSEPDNAELQRDLSGSYRRLGDVQQVQGRLKTAVKSYKNSLAIVERLAKSDPDNAGLQHELAQDFAKLASVYRQSGNKATARAHLRDGRAIISRLTEISPDNEEWKRDLAWFNDQIAKLAKRR